MSEISVQILEEGNGEMEGESCAPT